MSQSSCARREGNFHPRYRLLKTNWYFQETYVGLKKLPLSR